MKRLLVLSCLLVGVDYFIVEVVGSQLGVEVHSGRKLLNAIFLGDSNYCKGSHW